MLFAWSAFLVAGLLLALTSAVRSQYLVVLYWTRHGLVLLERRGAERYRIVSPFWVPVALARYVLLGAAAMAAGAQRRVAGWTHAHLHRHPAASVKA